ncbi:unnamed protein product [Pleuronectes platessa]|uniref:Uncharacterized protein n=1 Tax=Pleuronectes platessa TaxID=8262 RepID=A0A9N7YUP4_PLEPL|nr:unnamed protein product [Pleuronectes platessa]
MFWECLGTPAEFQAPPTQRSPQEVHSPAEITDFLFHDPHNSATAVNPCRTKHHSVAEETRLNSVPRAREVRSIRPSANLRCKHETHGARLRGQDFTHLFPGKFAVRAGILRLTTRFTGLLENPRYAQATPRRSQQESEEFQAFSIDSSELCPGGSVRLQKSLFEAKQQRGASKGQNPSLFWGCSSAGEGPREARGTASERSQGAPSHIRSPGRWDARGRKRLDLGQLPDYGQSGLGSASFGSIPYSRLLVDEHKTVKTFGQALNAKEFSWLRQLYDGNCCVKGKSSRNIFHTFLGSSITKPVNFLHLAWTDAGLRGPITFNMIRSSVSTQAERHLSETERRKVALSMCHDPSTAERFYVSLPTRDVAYENRKLRMKALMHEKRKARAKPKPLEEESSYSLTSESSEEDEEPVYDDRPETTSLSSEEELMRKTQTRLKKRFFFPSGAKRKLESVGGPEIISPSKIHVTVERLNPIVAQQYQGKWSITVDVPKNETGVASSHQPGTTEGTPSGRAKPRPEEGAPDGAPAAGPAAAGAAAGAAAEPASPPASPPRPGTRSSRRGLLQAGIEAQIYSSGGEDESKALDPLSAVFLPWSGNSQVLLETQMSNDVQESQNGAAAGNNPTSSL